MQLRYYPETDTLYIALREAPSAESEEIAPNVVVDYDAAGAVVGFEIDRVASRVDLEALHVSGLESVHVLAGSRSRSASLVANG